MPGNVYQVTVRGFLNSNWSLWFDGWTIKHDKAGNSIMVSPPIDQATLHGVLRKIQDLNLPLISVRILNIKQ